MSTYTSAHMASNTANAPPVRIGRFTLTMALALAGVAISGYLLYRTLALKRDWQTAGLDICSAVFGTDCDAVLTDATTSWLGLPVAAWGFVYFGLITVTLVMAISHRESFFHAGNLLALTISIVGVGISVYLVSQIARGLVAYCPLCIVVHAVNFTLSAAILWHDGRSPRVLMKDLSAGIAYALGASSRNPTEAKWQITAIITCVLAGLVLYQWSLIQTERATRAHEAEHAAQRTVTPLSAFLDSPEQDIPIRADDPRLGNVDAPVQLVIFSDFECPACAKMASWTNTLRSEFGNDIAVVFKHYPLSSQCNPAVTSDFHPDACNRAIFAEAARNQNAFWKFHDFLFEQNAEYELDSPENIAATLGLDPAMFKTDIDSKSGLARILEDAALGEQLGIVGTPTALINGRIVEFSDLDDLKVVIRQILTNSRLTGSIYSLRDNH